MLLVVKSIFIAMQNNSNNCDKTRNILLNFVQEFCLSINSSLTEVMQDQADEMDVKYLQTFCIFKILRLTLTTLIFIV